MKVLKTNINGREVGAPVLRTASHLWVHLHGRTLAIPLVSSRSHKQQQQAQDPSKIFAPMPGKIIKVLSSPADIVKSGQTLIVMEAMKMEYTLKCHLDGVVEKINCKVGDQVSLGDLLAELRGAE